MTPLTDQKLAEMKGTFLIGDILITEIERLKVENGKLREEVYNKDKWTNVEIDRQRKEIEELKDRPKIVCICGSSRFADWAAVHSWHFSKMGRIVLSYELLPQWYWEATGKVGHGHAAEQEGVAEILDGLHLEKIKMADEVFIINKDGYIGERTGIEIQFAKSLGKPVSYMEPVPAALTAESEGEK